MAASIAKCSLIFVPIGFSPTAYLVPIALPELSWPIGAPQAHLDSSNLGALF